MGTCHVVVLDGKNLFSLVDDAFLIMFSSFNLINKIFFLNYTPAVIAICIQCMYTTLMKFLHFFVLLRIQENAFHTEQFTLKWLK